MGKGDVRNDTVLLLSANILLSRVNYSYFKHGGTSNEDI